MLLRTLKELQIAVAIATTLALGAGLLWPGAMGLMLTPLGLVYVFWAARAALDRPLSIRLAFASTLIVAVFLGAFATLVAAAAFDTGGAESVPRFPEAQAEAQREERFQAGVLLLIGAAAWVVVGLHGAAREWAFSRDEPT